MDGMLMCLLEKRDKILERMSTDPSYINFEDLDEDMQYVLKQLNKSVNKSYKRVVDSFINRS